MNLFKLHHPRQTFTLQISQITPPQPPLSPPPHFLSLPLSSIYQPKLAHSFNLYSSPVLSSVPAISLSKPNFRFRHFRVSETEASTSVWSNEEEENIGSTELEDLASDGAVYQKTLRLVECSMFAAVSGLAYFLSNSLAIENYFGCFFSLPIVISSMRWGVAAGRKTMVATATLLLVLSGPVKALTYLLMHGLVGVTMGSLWRLEANWSLSVFVCSLVRAMGAMGLL
ncbi:uncharacterized protein LOC132302691 isoform X2 [Cornus florida]|uniref:uncharacterized protein LOC132302691 isoform X2 n=1 Tax=Cornus florida TaxID=4283 RepID=UPI0028984CDD|nr:uncharacterized protein LOC132302691 isoform X2 [Cornus florida]